MSAILHTASGVVLSVGSQIQHTSNRLLPPKRREETLEKMRAFAVANPKAAAFLAAQVALTGIPLVCFFAFATSVLLISLTTAILTALTGAFLFTLFTVGFALLFVIPILFIASCTATFLFFWGLGGYFVLRRFNDGEAPVKPGTRVGDKFQDLTGGRLSWMADGTSNAPTRAGDKSKTQATNGNKNGYGGGDSHNAQDLEDNGSVKFLRIVDVKKTNGENGKVGNTTNGYDFADEKRDDNY